jgi:acetylornithine deacetylase/succinyl-diaminopimelate desuccinylase-like protein
MSLFAGTPAIKVGPGDSARSHRPDEYVTVAELAEGAAFYGLLLAELAASAREIANSRSVSKVG